MKMRMRMRMRMWPLGVLSVVFALALSLGGCGSATPADGTDTSANAAQSAGADAPLHVYLAGPFFNDEEIENIEFAESVLDDKGLEYFSPMRHGVDAEPGTTEWADEIFAMDKEQTDKADVVVAMYYGNYSDSGTAWECGYASAIGKPVVLVHTERGDDSNLMLHCSATTNIYLDELADYDFATMPAYEYEGEMF